MQEGKKVEFTQKWIADAVKKLLQKEDIYESDMDRIKYLRIGEAYGGYRIEMSTATPADPFWDAVEADNGWDEVVGDVIRLYIDYAKEHPFEIVYSRTGERFFGFHNLSSGRSLGKSWRRRQKRTRMRMGRTGKM